jgi:hypothetical protein
MRRGARSNSLQVKGSLHSRRDTPISLLAPPIHKSHSPWPETPDPHHMASTSAQLLHTCEVASQSYLQPKTYLPGARSAGIFTRSRIACVWSFPFAPSARGGKADWPFQLLSQREQSEPGVPGHGTHGPPMQPVSPGRHLFLRATAAVQRWGYASGGVM